VTKPVVKEQLPSVLLSSSPNVCLEKTPSTKTKQSHNLLVSVKDEKLRTAWNEKKDELVTTWYI
jgi:hypothetical protein